MSYTRAAFREWLATLPQDKPRSWQFGVAFGAATTVLTAIPTCPIGDFLNCGTLAAAGQDKELVRELDSKLPWPTGRITPRQVIALIDEMGNG
jgi:hypothetical protein